MVGVFPGPFSLRGFGNLQYGSRRDRVAGSVCSGSGDLEVPNDRDPMARQHPQGEFFGQIAQGRA